MEAEEPTLRTDDAHFLCQARRQVPVNFPGKDFSMDKLLLYRWMPVPWISQDLSDMELSFLATYYGHDPLLSDDVIESHGCLWVFFRPEMRGSDMMCNKLCRRNGVRGPHPRGVFLDTFNFPVLLEQED